MSLTLSDKSLLTGKFYHIMPHCGAPCLSYACRLIATEEDSRQVKIEMSELKARHKSELERMSRAKERELEEVHERVKQALAKKEGNLKSLRAQHEVRVELM